MFMKKQIIIHKERLPDKRLQMMRGRRIIQRDFRLQHLLVSPYVYELGLVNTAPTKQNNL